MSVVFRSDRSSKAAQWSVRLGIAAKTLPYSCLALDFALMTVLKSNTGKSGIGSSIVAIKMEKSRYLETKVGGVNMYLTWGACRPYYSPAKYIRCEETRSGGNHKSCACSCRSERCIPKTSCRKAEA